MSSSHEAAGPRLAEYALGHVDAGEAAQIQQHVAECTECRAHLRFVETLRDLLSNRAPEILLDHPDAHALARLALDDPDLDLATRAELGAHLRICSICDEGVRAARSAEASRVAQTWWKRARTWFFHDGRPGPASSLLAAAAVAWVMWVALPSKTTQDGTPVGATVLLAPATRSGDAPPELLLSTHANTAVLFVRYDPWNDRPDSSDFGLEIQLRGGAHEWTTRAPASGYWVEELGVTQILVPRTALRAGVMSLTIRDDAGAVVVTTTFTVRED